MKTWPRPTSSFFVLWLFAIAGFWQTVEVGQIYIPLLLVTFLGLDNLKKNKPIVAGILIGLLIAIKPQFALWAVLLFFTDQRRVSIVSAVTFILAGLIPLLVFGTEVYVQWLRAIAAYNGLLLPGSSSLQSLFAHLDIPILGSVLGVILVLCIMLFVVKKKISGMEASMIGLASIPLISPYSWCGYTLFLLPIFFDNGQWSWRKKLAAGLLTVPFLLLLGFYTKAKILFVLFGWVYGWAAVLLLLDETIVFRNVSFNRNV
jgi:hypothetical protein